MDRKKADAELTLLRSFIDFVNRQVGVYCDCLAGFQGNKVRVERQMPRLQRPTSRRIEDGQPVIMYVSVEDPSRPDVLHHRMIRADEFINVNSEAAFNEQHGPSSCLPLRIGTRRFARRSRVFVAFSPTPCS